MGNEFIEDGQDEPVSHLMDVSYEHVFYIICPLTFVNYISLTYTENCVTPDTKTH